MDYTPEQPLWLCGAERGRRN